MNSDKEEIPFLENIGIFITYKCQAACPHCVVEAGPNRKEKMRIDDAFKWIEQAAKYQNHKINGAGFTGGEPFYDIDTFQKIIKHTALNGLIPTVVTNAFWADSYEKALEVLESMPELRIISISTDEHHLPFIPFERVKNALFAAKQLGLMYTVSVCTEDDNSIKHKNLMTKLEEIVDRSFIDVVITFPAGRAVEKIHSSEYNITEELPNASCSSANMPVVFPDGRVIACIGPIIDIKHGHPLLLGNLNEKPLDEILNSSELNTVLHLIRVWGPQRIFTMLKENGYGDRLPKTHIKDHICHLCYELMKDEELCSAIKKITKSEQMKVKIAYARQYYLKENTMMDMLGITEEILE